jgi:D-alanyl-D-alanine carboxypeptidase/D-alanyl-D-alanine carboxypeptidase (penicillin-binding protein 5/6)
MTSLGGLGLRAFGARLAAALLVGGLVVTPVAQAASKHHHAASAKKASAHKSSSHGKVASRKSDKHQRHASASRTTRQPVRAARAVAARPSPRYAAILMDARNREVLYAQAADEQRHPASITKVMTLFLAFDALSDGKLKLNDRITMSAHAAAQKPSKLGLKVGESLSVDQAIRVIAVKSANDLAVALAERIAGSEPAFVQMMQRKARELGMRNTVYANASGLTDPTNVTSARDIALLSVALLREHPEGYSYFSLRDASFGAKTFSNHNHLLGKVIGLDGIKTGYTVDAGFTLAASAMRNNRRLIAVVLGEPSIAVRNRDATNLLEAGFKVITQRDTGTRQSVADVLPLVSHPAFRNGVETEQGSDDESSPRRGSN